MSLLPIAKEAMEYEAIQKFFIEILEDAKKPKEQREGHMYLCPRSYQRDDAFKMEIDSLLIQVNKGQVVDGFLTIKELKANLVLFLARSFQGRIAFN
jgi:hypothetical protein